MLKVDIVARTIRDIDPGIHVDVLPSTLISAEAFAALRQCDVIFGCFDDDGPRSVLNDFAVAYEKLYFDLASDVPDDEAFGGRVCVTGLDACLMCLGVLDARAISRYFESPEQRKARIYGVNVDALEQKGPSVAPLNGVIASLAATEFMVHATGKRAPVQHLNYLGHLPKMTVILDRSASCHVCATRGSGERADVERYLRALRR